MIAIVGATGSLGGEVARRLLATGHRVVAVTRAPAKAAALQASGAEVRVADLTDGSSLRSALRGASAVFAAAHSLLGRGRYRSTSVDDAGHRALIDAAVAERVGQVVYTSVVGASADHPATFWRTKYAIERHLEASGLDFTILRPTAFMETHAHELVGKAILSGKPAVIFGRGEQRMNFVAARDVARFAVVALTDPAARNITIEIGGRDNCTRHEVAELYARLSGQPLRVRHIPVGALRFLSAMIRPLHPGISDVMRMSVAFETIDQTFDPSETLGRFPMPLTSLETFVRERIEDARTDLAPSRRPS